jgi:tetratricopeptide (TPR) repeat protein
VRTTLGSGQRLVLLTGPTGAGKRALGLAATEELRPAPLIVDGSSLRSLEEVLDAIVAQSDTLTVPSRDDPEAMDRAFAGQKITALISHLDQLDHAQWEAIAAWVSSHPTLNVVATAMKPPEQGCDSMVVFPVQPLAASQTEQRGAAYLIFLDAVSDDTLRARLSQADDQTQRAAVEACGGLPLLLKLAGVRTRFLEASHVLALLVESEAPSHLHALSSLFGPRYAEALARTLQRLPLDARLLLALSAELGSVHTLDDVWRVLEALRTAFAEPADAGAQRLALAVQTLLSDTLSLIQLLAELGFIEVQKHDTITTFRVPRHVMAVLQNSTVLAAACETDAWLVALPVAASQSLAEGAARILELSDRYDERAARLLARRLREPLIQMLVSDARAAQLRPAQRLHCLGALAWFWRRTGIERRLWWRCFQQMLDASSPDHFSADEQRGPGCDRIAQALAETHLLARQAGDAAARDALAGRMNDLLLCFDDAYDRGSASARSRFGYVLGAAAFTAGNRELARELADRSLSDARDAARQDLQARHSTLVAFLEFEAGQHHAAIDRMEQSTSVLRRLGALQDFCTASANLAVLAYQHGAIDLATTSFRQAADNEATAWDAMLKARALMGLARCLDVLQDPAAEAVHAETLALANEIGDDAQRAEAMTRYGWHLLLQHEGRSQDALQQMQEAMDLEQKVARERLRTHTIHAYAVALAAAEQTDIAYQFASDALSRINPARAQHHCEVAALVASLTPDLDQAVEQLAAAADQASRLDSAVTLTLIKAEELYLQLRRQAAGHPGAATEEEVADALRWLMAPVDPPFGSSRVARPRWQRSLVLAGTMRRVRRRLTDEMVYELESELYHRAGELLICGRGLRVQLGDGEWLDLSTAPVLARLFYAIAANSATNGLCSVEECVAAGWPGEFIQHDAALNRIYQAISRLRRLGLRDVIEAADGGYRIRHHLRIFIPPRT